MSINVIKSHEQNRGAFDNGLIRERKPIAFPSEQPVQPPFSTLFYWAHAWSLHGGTIAEHPHRGFEICTFVLDGSIEHYDNKTNAWIKLEAGDVQIIRAGSGIRHAEKIGAGGRIFQLWFDPNLKQSLGIEPSYEDFRASSFAVSEGLGIRTQTLVGYGSPLRMDSPTRIRRVQFQKGRHELPMTAGYQAGAFLIEGAISLGGNALERHDFAVITDEPQPTVNASEAADLFVVEVPYPAPYETFAESRS
jgi:redox-sensitive bicupin YhaK (pirin superfamily)